MKRIATILIIVIIVLGIAFGMEQYINANSNLLHESTLFKAKSFITNATVLGDKIAIGTYDGNIYVIGIDGKMQWKAKIGTNIFGIEKDDNGDILVCSVYFYMFDKNGKKLFEKGYKNFLGVKGKFLNSGNIDLLYQSLDDFSYLVVTVDKKGNTLSKVSIPDLGESASISITDDGKLLFVGSRGEIYLLGKDGGIEETLKINNKSGDLHNVFGYIFPNGNIVYGYTLSTAEIPNVPVVFYTDKGEKTVTLHSNINRITKTNVSINFATNEEFLTFSPDGTLLKRETKYGFVPMEFTCNKNAEALLYMRKLENKDKNAIYNIILKDNNKKTMKFIFSSEVPPDIKMDSESNIIFLIEKNSVNILYKK